MKKEKILKLMVVLTIGTILVAMTNNVFAADSSSGIDFFEDQTNQLNTTTNTNTNTNTNANTNSDEMTYDKWRLEVIYPLVDKLALSTGSNRRTILSSMYKKMNNIYGIVWQQLYKDYIKKYGTKASSTLRSIYYLEKEVPYGTYGNEHYEDLLENLLKKDISNIK